MARCKCPARQAQRDPPNLQQAKTEHVTLKQAHGGATEISLSLSSILEVSLSLQPKSQPNYPTLIPSNSITYSCHLI